MAANSKTSHLRSVDNKPIIVKVKHQVPELAAIDEHSVRGDTDTDTCSCSKRCLLFEKIPIDQGIMVMMDEPTTSGLESETQVANGYTNDCQNCSCLKIQPQSDSNLAAVHPNIYIPSSLLDYPEQIIKYGGGGSGVTVFGGYHPELGSLVMKHGGHKDLLELVSLYKIERELMVRGNTKMDLVAKAIAKDSAPDESTADQRSRRFSFNAFGGSFTSGASTVVRKISSQPILSRVGSLLFRRSINFDNKDSSHVPSLSNVETMPISSSYQSFDLMQKQCHSLENSGGGHDAQIQAIEDAIKFMKQRIPAFRMFYISPMHLREREGELRNSTFRTSLRTSLRSSFDKRDRSASEIIDRTYSEGEQEKELQISVTKQGRSISLFGSPHASSSSIRTHSRHVDLCFGGGYRLWRGAANDEIKSRGNSAHSCPAEDEGNDGYESLLAFVNQLYHHMQLNDWKVTLAQQTIGRSPDEPTKSAPTASSLLAKGKLKGRLLHHLLDEEIRVIRNLQLLTMPNEVDVLDGVRMEYESIKARMRSANANENKVTAADVSSIANSFVGKAIHKNFHPVTGRFILLRKFGADLRDGLIHLKPKEHQPAKHLEKILNDCFERGWGDIGGCGPSTKGHRLRMSLEEVFDLSAFDETADEEHSLQGHPLFIHGLDQWQSLLELALSMKNPNATARIWTCGLTDGGLHNLFLDENQVWMFDLGEPGLETIPGFLTKFLMSFFHTLGMEEEPNGDWVVRFVQNSDKLRLTEKTKELLPGVIEAFNVAIDRLIKELFGGDEEVRVLLLRYVMTQLISDAAFCIEKWRIKGGGDKERSEHQYYLEKWLWRALWDVYACEEIRRRHLSRQAMKRQDSHLKRLI